MVPVKSPVTSAWSLFSVGLSRIFKDGLIVQYAVIFTDNT